MSKKSDLRLEPIQLVLPEELPFEKGTNLGKQDDCSRLAFQLLVERLLPPKVIQKLISNAS